MDKVIEKFQNELVSGICDRKVFHEGIVQTFITPFVGFGFKLKKVLKRFNLNVQEIRVVRNVLSGCETYSFSLFCEHLRTKF